MNRKQRRADSKQPRNVQESTSQALAGVFASAFQHANAGRSEEVIKCFRKGIKIAPDFAVSHYNLGKALGEQSRLDEAVACFRKTIALAPDMAEG